MRSSLRSLEWPTLGLLALVYGGFAALCLASPALPWFAIVPAAAVILALHGSLQHECIHLHPTRSVRFNTLLASWPLALWLPYELYRRSHLGHHASPALTDPACDPESFYASPEQWRRRGPARRALSWALQTLLGRLVLGPFVLVGQTLRDELPLVVRGLGDRRRVWAVHMLQVSLIMAFVVGVCGVHPGLYVAAFVWPGVGLTLLRSYAEHRPDPDPARRTTVVESPLIGLVFLHNNLHVVHHDRPGLPWYRLPAAWRSRKARALEQGVEVREGYRSLLRYAVSPKDSPVHPLPLVDDRPEAGLEAAA